jgi:hypothetical protein
MEYRGQDGWRQRPQALTSPKLTQGQRRGRRISTLQISFTVEDYLWGFRKKA